MTHPSKYRALLFSWYVFLPLTKRMDSEQELREFQREYLDFLDDDVSVLDLS